MKCLISYIYEELYWQNEFCLLGFWGTHVVHALYLLFSIYNPSILSASSSI